MAKWINPTAFGLKENQLVLITWLDAGFDPAATNRDTKSIHEILLTKTPGFLQGVELVGDEQFLVFGQDLATNTQTNGVYVVPLSLVRSINGLSCGRQVSLTAKDLLASIPTPKKRSTSTLRSSKPVKRRR